MLILTDFDGTITEWDVTNALLDKFTGRVWRETTLPRFWSGEISHLELMQLLYADLREGPADLLPHFKDIPIRTGFAEFIKFCQAQNYFLAVVSGGLDFYVKEFIKDELDIPAHHYRSRFDAEKKRWEIFLPDFPTVDRAAGEDFKVRVLEELKKEQPANTPSVFIGDGRNDFPVSRQADIVFAVQGSRLAQMRQEAGLPVYEFETFDKVAAILQNIQTN